MPQGASTIAVDAKQRFLVTTEEGVEIGGGDSDTGSQDGLSTETASLRKVCLEPSPDIFSTLSSALEGSAKYKDKASADFKAAVAEAAATIGARTETIQLLRDAMYRICELGLNGGLESKHALELHQKYHRSMVTLAAVAALADVARPAQVVLGGRSMVTRGSLIAELTKKIDNQKGEAEAKTKKASETATALREQVAVVCKEKIDVNSCAGEPAKCAAKADGEELCSAQIAGSAATVDNDKSQRTEQYCSNDARQKTDSCKKLATASASAKGASQEEEQAKSALKDLEEDLDNAKKSSDLSAATVVTVAPAPVQPRSQNIAAVAGVVGRLVTQVYADGHIQFCLDVLDRQQKANERIAMTREKLAQVRQRTLEGSDGTVQAAELAVMSAAPIAVGSSQQNTQFEAITKLEIQSLEQELSSIEEMMALCKKLVTSLTDTGAR